MPSLWLVDGSHAIFRAYHALPHLSTRQGVPTNAVYGFTTMLLKAIREGEPTHFAVCFDEEAKQARSEIYAEYKATRGPMPEDLAPQFPLVRRVLEALDIPAVGMPGWEADDVIATLTRRARKEGFEVVVVTGDKDLLQLVEDGVRCYDTMYEKWYGPKEVEDKWGVPPAKVADLLALTGDKIDNVPGIPGVGEKTAAALLAEYGSLEGVLEHAGEIKKPKLRENALASIEAVRRARKLIQLNEDLPVPVQLGDLVRRPPREDKARSLFIELEFSRLLKDLPRPPAVAPSGARSLAIDLAAVEKLAARMREEGRTTILTLTTEDEPLHDELLGIDSRLASYLLDPTGRDHSLAQTARERIGCELPLLKELCEKSGKGKKATPLPEVSVDEVSAAACALGEGARRLCEALEKDLREDPELWRLYSELELPLSGVLASVELAGISLDVGRLETLNREIGAQIEQLLREITELAGEEFLPTSNQQLAEILYKKLHLPVLKRGKTGPSTDQEVLEELAEQHPLPKKVLEHRQLVKLKNTYLDALPAALGKDRRLHTTFDQAVAATGRLSSVNPNLQNIPIRTVLGAKIREAFIPREGWRLLSADYSQIELRILAHVSGDPVLRESFLTGEDLHARTAAETFGLRPDQVSRQQRDIAKMINYGIAYGLSAFGLAHRLGLAKDEAASIIDRYFARYAKVKEWLDGTIEEARKTGMVKTLFGRRRYLPDIHSRNPAARNAAERTAVNTPIQGTAADLIKRAMLLVNAALEGEKAKMLLQVHDELVLEAPPEEAAKVGQMLVEQMKKAADLAVPLEVDLGEGKTWAEAH